MPRGRRSKTIDATAWYWRVVDAGLVIALPVTALCFGGRHDLGRMVYVIGVAVACFGWLAARAKGFQGRRPTKAYVLIAAAALLIALQLTQLPAGLRGVVAPGISSALPLYSGVEKGLSFGEWTLVSLAPGETRLGLALFAAHAALFFVVLQRLADLEQIERLAKVIACLSAGMALLGLAQWLLPNGKMLWFYDHPQRDFSAAVQGSFFNANHFAHYVVLGVPAQVMLLLQTIGAVPDTCSTRSSKRAGWRSSRLPQILGWSASLLVSVVGVLLADSRGALVALLLALAVTAAFAWRHGLLRWRGGPLPIAAGVVVVGAVLIGGQLLFSRTVSLAAAWQEGDFAEQAGREAIWDANARAFAANPWLGWGVGSHRFVYKRFMEDPSSTEFLYAESGYLQIATEAGVAGLAVLFCALTLLASWCWRLGTPSASERSGKSRAGWFACCFVPPLFVSVLHSAVDFVWYVPACFALTLAAAAAALRLVQLRLPTLQASVHKTGTKHARYALPIVALAGACAGVFAYAGPASASLDWDRYLRVSRAMRAHGKQAPATEETAPQRLAETRAYLSEMLPLLRGVVAAHPGHIDARLRLASRELQAFELAVGQEPGAIPAVQVRDAALASGFPSLDETAAWMRRAFGDRAALLPSAHHQSARSIALCPLVGEAYLALAELSFLSPPSLRDHRSLIEQSVSLRPVDGRVLFQAGRLLSSEGRHDEATDLWRRSCRCPGSHRQMLSVSMAQGAVPARVVLDELSPPWPMFSMLANAYKTLGSDEDCRALARYGEGIAGRVDASRGDKATSGLLVVVGRLWQQVGDLPAAIAVTTEADRLRPNSLGVRYQLARQLIEAGEFDRAAPHVRWCLARQPGLKGLQRALAEGRRRPRLAVSLERGLPRPAASLADPVPAPLQTQTPSTKSKLK